MPNQEPDSKLKVISKDLEDKDLYRLNQVIHDLYAKIDTTRVDGRFGGNSQFEDINLKTDRPLNTLTDNSVLNYGEMKKLGLAGSSVTNVTYSTGGGGGGGTSSYVTVQYPPAVSYSGAIQRIIGEKVGETISVLDFGAKGDGVTDDAPAFTAAIAAAIASKRGKRILIPACPVGSFYKLDSAITVDNYSAGDSAYIPLQFEGEGDLSLVKRGASLASASVGLFDVKGENITFYNFCVDGDVTTPTGLRYGASGGFNDDPMSSALTQDTSFWIHGPSKNVTFYQMTITHTGGYSILVDATNGSNTYDADCYDIWDTKILECNFLNNRPHLFGKPSSGTIGYGSWTGGIFLNTYGVQDASNYLSTVYNTLVQGCFFRGNYGNCIWSHLYGFDVLFSDLRVLGNTFIDNGLDCILFGGVTGGSAIGNRTRRTGYIPNDHSNDVDSVSNPTVPKWLYDSVTGFNKPATALDTSGVCKNVSYANNTFISTNGGDIDADGFCDGTISGNACLTPRPADGGYPGDPEYTEDSISVSGPLANGDTWSYGCQPSNSYGEDWGGQNITITGNSFTNKGGGAINLAASRGCYVSGNNIIHPSAPQGAPIRLLNIGTADNQRTYNTVVINNYIQYDPASQQPAIVETHEYGAFQSGDKNWVHGNQIVGNSFEFQKDPVTSSSTAFTFSLADSGITSVSNSLAERFRQTVTGNNFDYLQFSYQTSSGTTQAAYISDHSVLGISGYVTTSGSTVTWSSGDDFTLLSSGDKLTINGSSYTISSKTSSTSLTLSSSPATNTTPTSYFLNDGSSASVAGCKQGAPFFNVGNATSGSISTGDRFNISFEDVVSTNVFSGDGFLSLTDKFENGSLSFSDKKADKLGNVYGLIRFDSSAAAFKVSTSTINGQRNWSTLGTGGSVAGSNTQIQFNNGGAFGASGYFTFEQSTAAGNLGIVTIPTIKFSNVASAPTTASGASLIYMDGGRLYVSENGGAPQYLVTSGGSGTPGGSSGAVQFNDASTFGGTSNFFWDKTNNYLSLGGTTSGLTARLYVRGAAHIWADDASQLVLLAKGTSSQSGNLFEAQNNSGGTLLAVNPAGGLYFRTTGTPSGAAGVGLIYYDTTANKFKVNENNGTTYTLGPAGSNTYVQYNDGGVPGADANFTWDKTNKLLTITGTSGTAGIVANTSYIQSAQGFYTPSTSYNAIQAPSGGLAGNSTTLSEYLAIASNASVSPSSGDSFTGNAVIFYDQTGGSSLVKLKYGTGSSTLADAFGYGAGWYATSSNTDAIQAPTGGVTAKYLIATESVNWTETSAPGVTSAGQARMYMDSGDHKLKFSQHGSSYLNIATVGGSTTQVQYNSSGAMAGSSNFTWDNSLQKLSIAGTASSLALDVTEGYVSSNDGYYTPSSNSNAINVPSGGVTALSLIAVRNDGSSGITISRTSATARNYGFAINSAGHLLLRDDTAGSTRLELDDTGQFTIGSSIVMTQAGAITISGVLTSGGVASTSTAYNGIQSYGTGSWPDGYGGMLARSFTSGRYIHVGSNSGAPTATTGDSIANGCVYYDTSSNTLKARISGSFADLVTTSSVVTSATGTANQVLVNGTSGSAQTSAITLTLPQSIGTGSSPSFASLTLNNAQSLYFKSSTNVSQPVLTLASNDVLYLDNYNNTDIYIRPAPSRYVFLGSASGGYVTPQASNNVSLGSSTYLWSGVYANGYYIGSTQVIDSTRTTSFLKDVIDNATNTVVGGAGTNGLFFKNASGTAYQSLFVYSDNNLYMDNYNNSVSGGNMLLRPVNGGYVQVGLSGVSSGSLKPGADNAMTLGTSSAGWSAAYARTYYYWNGSAYVAGTFGGGVTSATGTANQVLVNSTSGSAQTGPITLTLPQSIGTTSSPTFGGLTLNGLLDVPGGNIQVSSSYTYCVSGGYYGQNVTGGIACGGSTLYFKGGILYSYSSGNSVTSLTAGSGISVNQSTGSVTVTNSWGAVNTYATALNQSLTTSSSPTFNGLTSNDNIVVSASKTYAVSGGYYGQDATGGLVCGGHTLYFKNGILYAYT